LASASEDNIVRIWDSVKGIMQKRDTGHPNEVQYLAFSPGGRLLASASVDGTVGVWDPITGTLQRMYNVERFIIHIEFARKGLPIFTTSKTTCFIK
jgi:WD40 repeat protein